MSNNEKRSRILIGVPCYGKVDHEILEDWMRFAYHLGRRMPQYDFLLGIKPKTEQFRARNAIVDEARRANCEWLLMLDDDMIINTFVTRGAIGEGDSSYDFLAKLIAHDKDICGALYYQRGGNCDPVCMYKVSENGYRFLREDEIERGLQKVDVAGGGCLLVKMNVFDKIVPPYFAPEHKWSTDIQLCKQAQEKGYEIWVDTSIELGHLKDEKAIITSRNRKQFQMEQTVPGDAVKQFVSADIYSRLVDDALEFTGRENKEQMFQEANVFMHGRKESGLSDPDWYRQFPMERVSRQIWFNTQSDGKRQMTEFILSAIPHDKKLNIMDFGCGIGIPAFYLAEKGHEVTAMDIKGTGTLEFLKWRSKKHSVPIKFIESEGGPPTLNGEKYDVVIAMDSLEHIEQWKDAVKELASRIKLNGILFSNNGILEDVTHPEHYNVDNKEFIKVCMDENLMPVNQISYLKREAQ